MSTKAVPRIHLGYAHGLTQPATLLAIHIPVPRDGSIEQLDRWLECTFELTSITRPDAVEPDSREGSQAAELAWRVLQLAALLLRAVKVPVFDPGRILSVTPEGEGKFSVSVALPFVPVAAPPVMHRACHLATDTVIRLFSETGSPGHGHPLAEEIHDSFIKPTVERMPGGGSTVPLLGALYQAGVPFRHVAGSVYQLGWGQHATLMDSSSLQSDSAIGARISHNKLLAASLMRSAGLPAPVHRLVSSEQAARQALEQLGAPVVVKPVDRDRGEGVSVDISDESSLFEAARAAAALSRGVLVEKQVPGVCHRLMVFKGQVLFVVKRLPKAVKGDGVHTVAQLIDQANAREQMRPPWLRLKPFPADALAQQSLSSVGMTLTSLPAPGEYAWLRPYSRLEWGGVVEEATESIHPDNRDIAVRAARLFGLEIAGIDLITPDITVPWHENGAILNEVNYSPFFNDGIVAGKFLSTYANAVFPSGEARIPVEIYVGGERAWHLACERHQQLAASGVKVCLTSDRQTLGTDGAVRAMPTASLFDRATALLMDRQVQQLVLVVQTDELAQLGLPLDRIDRLQLVDRQLTTWGGKQPLSSLRFEALRDLLQCYSLDDSASGEV